ncbi:MAG: hypothetical protein R6X33_06555 [Candidatus Brocadiia bacterium]
MTETYGARMVLALVVVLGCCWPLVAGGRAGIDHNVYPSAVWRDHEDPTCGGAHD